MHLTGISNGIEVTMLSDIPSEGSGLGSSSSFTVGLLTAIHTYLGSPADHPTIAEEACEIEIDRCGKPKLMASIYSIMRYYGSLKEITAAFCEEQYDGDDR